MQCAQGSMCTSGAMYSTVPTGEMASSCFMLIVSPKSPSFNSSPAPVVRAIPCKEEDKSDILFISKLQLPSRSAGKPGRSQESMIRQPMSDYVACGKMHAVMGSDILLTVYASRVAGQVYCS